MSNNIRSVLSPLLFLSYVFGLRIIEFPAGHSRPWLTCLYYLLFWPTYCFLMVYFLTYYVPPKWLDYKAFVWMQLLMGLISLPIRIYYDKKFKDCLRKLAIVEETLEKIGTTTDYQQLDRKVAIFVAAWCAIFLVLNLGDSIWWRQINKNSILTAICIPFLVNLSGHTNFIDDLMFAYILGFIGLKFDQVNENFQRLADGEFTDRERRLKRAWENTLVMRSHRRKCLNALSSECMTHLHLELCKISNEINSVFGIQITLKMIGYFCLMGEYIWEIFSITFANTVINFKWYYICMCTLWLLTYLGRFMLINCSCDIVSNKANGTRDFINKIMYSTNNPEIREHIVQLLLQITRAPLKFDGFGFFYLGFNLLYKYLGNILTFLIILIQARKDKHIFTRDYTSTNHIQ